MFVFFLIHKMEEFIKVCNNFKSYQDSLKYWVNKGDCMNDAVREGFIDKNGVSKTHNLSSRQCKMYNEDDYHLKRLNELLALTKLSTDMTFRRCMWEDIYSELMESDMVEQKTIMSVTTNYNESFGDVKMIINVPANTPAFYVSIIDSNKEDSEDETILPPCTMKYMGKSEDGEYVFQLIETHPLFSD